MKILLVFTIALLAAFNSLSQSDCIIFNHNGYSFHTNIESVVDYFHLSQDSVEIYTNILKEISLKESSFNSETVLEVGALNLTFNDILRLIWIDRSLVKIKRVSENDFIRCKVKIKTETQNSGLGGSSTTFLTLIDKKKRVQILHEVINVNLGC